MRINFQVKTNNRKIANLERKLKNVDIDAIVSKTANNLIKEMTRLVTTGSRTGRKYGDHIASAPLEPPANWSGDLVDSMKAVKKSNTEYEVLIGVPYARTLEEGLDNLKDKPRPFVQPSIDAVRKEFEKEIADIFKRYL